MKNITTIIAIVALFIASLTDCYGRPIFFEVTADRSKQAESVEMLLETYDTLLAALKRGVSIQGSQITHGKIVVDVVSFSIRVELAVELTDQEMASVEDALMERLVEHAADTQEKRVSELAKKMEATRVLAEKESDGMRREILWRYYQSLLPPLEVNPKPVFPVRIRRQDKAAHAANAEVQPSLPPR